MTVREVFDVNKPPKRANGVRYYSRNSDLMKNTELYITELGIEPARPVIARFTNKLGTLFYELSITDVSNNRIE